MRPCSSKTTAQSVWLPAIVCLTVVPSPDTCNHLVPAVLREGQVDSLSSLHVCFGRPGDSLSISFDFNFDGVDVGQSPFQIGAVVFPIGAG